MQALIEVDILVMIHYGYMFPASQQHTHNTIHLLFLSIKVSQKKKQAPQRIFPIPKERAQAPLHCILFLLCVCVCVCVCFCRALYGVCVASGMESARLTNSAILKANPSRFGSGPLGEVDL